jgi:hypothetical protein
VAVLLLVIAVLLPLATLSVLDDVRHSAPKNYRLDDEPASSEVRGNLHLQVIAINEWESTASVRVSASQTCGRTCPWGDRYLFAADLADGGGRASSQAVDLRAETRDVVTVLKLPIAGDPIRYPFDRYTLGVGIEVSHVDPDGAVTKLTRQEAEEYVDITLQGRIPRTTMSAPEPLRDPLLSEREDDALVVTAELSFGRPIYLKALTLLLVLLVAAAAAFAVFMRPLDQLVINSGGLVLGVWGVRSILLGSGVPGLTIVDITLVVVILFLLAAIAVRTLWLLEEDSAYKVLRRRGNTPRDD